VEQQPWQFAGSAPDVYERYKVPSVHGPVATRLLEPVQLRAGERVLDVACGTGIAARLAAPRVAPSGRVVGLDLHKGMLAVARACAAQAGLAIEWQEGDASSLPFARRDRDSDGGASTPRGTDPGLAPAGHGGNAVRDRYRRDGSGRACGDDPGNRREAGEILGKGGLLGPAGSPPGLRAEKIWDGKRLRP
jgi:SAM-dependent methyltransferase